MTGASQAGGGVEDARDGSRPPSLAAESGRGPDAGAEGDGPSLRQQHHQLTRELVLRAVVELLEEGELSDVTVPDVARAAGVSLRTVYRHFATREDLLAAASDWIAEHLFSDARLPEKLDDIVARVAVNAGSFDDHPNLVRAMAVTRAGNAVRSVRRTRRLEKLRRALREVTANLTPVEQRQAEAVFGYLVNMLAWVTMRDENGLSGEEIGEALTWALEVLVNDLRRRNSATEAENGNKQSQDNKGGNHATRRDGSADRATPRSGESG